jgi:8-oxo-dGTP pyrophosphatase MutT (NUDIX family)
MEEEPRGTRKFETRIPDGDNRPRMVCEDCGWINYENPRIIVGVLAEWDGRLLLGRRAIPPREGFWNVPAGF